MMIEASAGPVRAFLGLGGNLGNPLALFDEVITLLGNLPLASGVRESSRYESEPIDSSGPNYVNSVVALDWSGSASELLEHCMGLEGQLGRVRSTRNAPRLIDIDILLFGNQIIESVELTVPHPRMHLRRFVLEPLVELEESVELPGQGKAKAFLPTVMDQMVQRTN